MNRTVISILLFALMLGGLFFSRALLSITQGAWILFALSNRNNWATPLTKDIPFLWSCVPLLLFFAGCWQQPFNLNNYDYLLTLTAYPVTMLAIKSVPKETIKKYWLPAWGFATLIGLLYPLTWYLLHITGSNKAYGMGQSLPTFMDTDHVRFSIFLCSSFLFVLVYRTKPSVRNIFLGGGLFLVIIFLSVRTAWVILLFISTYFLIVRILLHRSDKILSFLKLAGCFIVVLGVAYFLFPTVQQKITYTIYDWQHFQPGKYDPDYSDGARRAVNHVAWQAIRHNGANAGWAGIPAALQKSFAVAYPGVTANYGWPFNQFLFWWLGAGGLGMLLFSAWVLYPFLWGWKHKNHGLVCWTVAIAASCFVESTLSLQYGVWLHVWPLAILWSMKNRQRETKLIS